MKGQELPATFEPRDVEKDAYDRWESSGIFEPSSHRTTRNFAMAIPPPNVTGVLHIGHALNHTLQDVTIRYHRMRGWNTLWQPGTDHAGIATQMVVERELEAEGTNREELGRQAFIERVWQWKDRSGNTINQQLKRLGASLAWQRERFTMDAPFSAAVRHVFISWYRAGIIYRDKRLVNWDPKFKTAISDLEVEAREIHGKIWYLRYPFADGSKRSIVVATTRPETMLGDVAVAVHPEDDRYRELIGSELLLPLTGRKIPIIGDKYSDPEKGTGAVKITPAHDFNDFEVGKRAGLVPINIFDEQACINTNAPAAYRGLERLEARRRILADLEAVGAFERVEDHVLQVPYGDRSGAVIEPRLTDQWFVDAAKLAPAAIEAVERGETRFIPKHWEKTYFEWLRNIEPWCISRQLWWGHPIPAWYGPDGAVFVAESEDRAQSEATAHYGQPVTLHQDKDVLDTWFSSQLWPFSTLGWPEQTQELERFFPNATLSTGFDIIFFWVARMMMASLYFLGKVPFRTVYIHALVRDEHGQKMSKSKGNVIDPVDLIDRYGADSTRFTLCALATQGRDIHLSEEVVTGYRNFANKFWNAARYVLMQLDQDESPSLEAAQGDLTPADRWILSRLVASHDSVASALDEYRFSDAAMTLYHFVWNEFCDWAIELSKPRLSQGSKDERSAAQATLYFTLVQLLHLLHPMMPYLTEEIWRRLPGRGNDNALLAQGPFFDGDRLTRDPKLEEDYELVQGLITALRSIRSETKIGFKHPIRAIVATESALDIFERHREEIVSLARLEDLDLRRTFAEKPAGSAIKVHASFEAIVPLEGLIDFEAERSRLEKQRQQALVDLEKLSAKLSNESFITKAPAVVVQKDRERVTELRAMVERLDAGLSALPERGASASN